MDLNTPTCFKIKGDNAESVNVSVNNDACDVICKRKESSSSISEKHDAEFETALSDWSGSTTYDTLYETSSSSKQHDANLGKNDSNISLVKVNVFADNHGSTATIGKHFDKVLETEDGYILFNKSCNESVLDNDSTSSIIRKYSYSQVLESKTGTTFTDKRFDDDESSKKYGVFFEKAESNSSISSKYDDTLLVNQQLNVPVEKKDTVSTINTKCSSLLTKNDSYLTSSKKDKESVSSLSDFTEEKKNPSSINFSIDTNFKDGESLFSASTISGRPFLSKESDFLSSKKNYQERSSVSLDSLKFEENSSLLHNSKCDVGLEEDKSTTISRKFSDVLLSKESTITTGKKSSIIFEYRGNNSLCSRRTDKIPNTLNENSNTSLRNLKHDVATETSTIVSVSNSRKFSNVVANKDSIMLKNIPSVSIKQNLISEEKEYASLTKRKYSKYLINKESTMSTNKRHDVTPQREENVKISTTNSKHDTSSEVKDKTSSPSKKISKILVNKESCLSTITKNDLLLDQNYFNNEDNTSPTSIKYVNVLKENDNTPTVSAKLDILEVKESKTIPTVKYSAILSAKESTTSSKRISNPRKQYDIEGERGDTIVSTDSKCTNIEENESIPTVSATTYSRVLKHKETVSLSAGKQPILENTEKHLTINKVDNIPVISMKHEKFFEEKECILSSNKKHYSASTIKKYSEVLESNKIIVKKNNATEKKTTFVSKKHNSEVKESKPSTSTKNDVNIDKSENKKRSEDYREKSNFSINIKHKTIEKTDSASSISRKNEALRGKKNTSRSAGKKRDELNKLKQNANMKKNNKTLEGGDNRTQNNKKQSVSVEKKETNKKGSEGNDFAPVVKKHYIILERADFYPPNVKKCDDMPQEMSIPSTSKKHDTILDAKSAIMKKYDILKKKENNPSTSKEHTKVAEEKENALSIFKKHYVILDKTENNAPTKKYNEILDGKMNSSPAIKKHSISVETNSTCFECPFLYNKKSEDLDSKRNMPSTSKKHDENVELNSKKQNILLEKKCALLHTKEKLSSASSSIKHLEKMESNVISNASSNKINNKFLEAKGSTSHSSKKSDVSLDRKSNIIHMKKHELEDKQIVPSTSKLYDKALEILTSKNIDECLETTGNISNKKLDTPSDKKGVLIHVKKHDLDNKTSLPSTSKKCDEIKKHDSSPKNCDTSSPNMKKQLLILERKPEEVLDNDECITSTYKLCDESQDSSESLPSVNGAIEEFLDKKETLSKKVVVRKLPPYMTWEKFQEEFDNLPPHDYHYFVKGDMSYKEYAFSRAYINFVHEEDLYMFQNKYNGREIVDPNGKKYKVVIELAPNSKIPKQHLKPDLEENTLESSPEFKEFLTSLQKKDDEKSQISTPAISNTGSSRSKEYERMKKESISKCIEREKRRVENAKYYENSEYPEGSGYWNSNYRNRRYNKGYRYKKREY